jgi:hypothetical protein
VDPADVFVGNPEGADAPVEGFYSVDRRGKVGLPVRIWYGQAADLDRGPRWQMQVGDRMIDPSDMEWDDVWPQCFKSPIDQGEYNYRLERIRYAKEHGAKSDPWAKRSGRIDLLTAPIPE